MRFRTLLLAVILLMCAPIVVFGQSDGSIPPADEKPADEILLKPTPPVEDRADPVPLTESGTAPQVITPATENPATNGPIPASPSAPVKPTPAPSSAPAETSPKLPAPSIDVGSATVEIVKSEETPSNSLLWLFLALFALIPFGFFAANYLKKKSSDTEESDSRCFDVKTMMEEKLRELTDVRAIVKGKAKSVAKDAIRDAVSGTTAGDLLVRAEKLESQYAKLKALFEECRIDAERYAYKGVVVENSLIDKKILENVRVIRTRTEGEWTLHDIRLSKKQIEDVQKSIADEKWYFHLWEPGKDQVTVVFKDTIFTIMHSDKQTWNDAITYGEAHGIPREQIDFRIV